MDRRDPEAKLLVQHRYKCACEQFKNQEISEDVFRATLYGCGFRGQAISTEVNLHWPEALRAKKELVLVNVTGA